MAAAREVVTENLVVDKAVLVRILEEIEAAEGFIPEPGATAQGGRELMLAAGIRPEDNTFSREILRSREGE